MEFVCGLQTLFHLLLESVLLGFDHNLEIYTISTLQQQFHPQGDWNLVPVAQLYVLLFS
jgi:hypothetical protein